MYRQTCKTFIKIIKKEIEQIDENGANKKISYENFNKYSHDKGEINKIEKSFIRNSEEE